MKKFEHLVENPRKKHPIIFQKRFLEEQRNEDELNKNYLHRCEKKPAGKLLYTSENRSAWIRCTWNK